MNLDRHLQLDNPENKKNSNEKKRNGYKNTKVNNMDPQTETKISNKTMVSN